MRKLLTSLMIMCLLITPLAGCSKDLPSQDKQALTQVTILLDWLPNTNHTGLYAAKDKGYFKAEGLDVTIMQPGEGGTSQLLAAGKGDFGVSYQEEVTIARSQDIPVVALAAVIQHNTSGFASPVEKGIKTPRDFEGKSYGGWGSPAETAIIKVLMDKYDADINTVEMVNIGSNDFFTSMHKGVDFAMIYWGWTGIEAELRDLDLNFIKMRDENPALDFYTPVLIANEKMVTEKPELVEKFIRACSKGYQFAIENPEEAAQLLLDNVPDLDRELVMASQEYLANEYKGDAPVWGQMTELRWQKYADWMYGQGLIEKPLDYQQAFTNEFLPKE